MGLNFTFMNHQSQASGSSQESEVFVEELFRVLIERGSIMPESIDEVLRALATLADENEGGLIVAEDSASMLDKIRGAKPERSSKIIQMPLNSFAIAKEELCRAARNGGSFSEAVESKMRANREKARNAHGK